MTPSPTDTLCTTCGLCCDGTLFADVELTGPAEAARLEIMGLGVDDDEPGAGLLSQPCLALRRRRCQIYAHRPNCCRLFECRLLQDVRQGAVTVERAAVRIAGAHRQIRVVRALLARLGNHDHRLPLKERCAEALSGDGGGGLEMTQERLRRAMAALERTIWNDFLGTGRRRA